MSGFIATNKGAGPGGGESSARALSLGGGTLLPGGMPEARLAALYARDHNKLLR